jgi:soluble lytic murein transglycosylase-like protein
MGCIMKEDHERVIKRIKRRSRIIHLAGITLTLAILFIPIRLHLERALTVEAYRIVRTEFDSLLARYQLLTILRTKPMTIGQALDVADVIMEQREVPVPLVLGIIEQESVFKAEAVSHKGARGLMQVMPIVWEKYLSDPKLNSKRYVHDPAMNVRVGLQFLADLKGKYKEWRKALRAYVGGPKRANDQAMDDYVDSVLAKAALYEKEIKRK